MKRLIKLLPLLLGIAALGLLEFTSIVDWLEVQTTARLLTGLGLLSTVVVVLSKNVADNADEVAEVIGQPFGTLVLTGSVITIELALVASTMLNGESNPTLARDSMFSVLMIALTGITGVCNIIAAVRQGRVALADDGIIDVDELASANLVGSNTYFMMISTMSVLALIIPNFSPLTADANFSTPVNVVLSVVAVGVYAIFLTAQMSSYSTLFSEVMPTIQGDLGDPARRLAAGTGAGEPDHTEAPHLPSAALLLMAGLLVVVLISESMGHLIEVSITDLGLPSSLAGALVALLILAPEALNSIQASAVGGTPAHDQHALWICAGDREPHGSCGSGHRRNDPHAGDPRLGSLQLSLVGADTIPVASHATTDRDRRTHEACGLPVLAAAAGFLILALPSSGTLHGLRGFESSCGQHIVAVLCHSNVVFNADADAFPAIVDWRLSLRDWQAVADIQPWLHRQDHTELKRNGLFTKSIGTDVMHIEPEPVAGAVHVEVSVITPLDDALGVASQQTKLQQSIHELAQCHGVNGLCRSSRPDGFHRCLL